VAHPDRYRAAVGLSGYNDPAAEAGSLTARTPALRAANDPYTLLTRSPAPPPVALYVSGQPGDGYEAAQALDRAAQAPTRVDVVYVPPSAGGHTMALWKPQVVPAFQWLSELMAPRGAPRATPPARSSAGSTHAEPASGTAWRAAAARRP
jgi:hypothetical protein